MPPYETFAKICHVIFFLARTGKVVYDRSRDFKKEGLSHDYR